MSAYDLFLDDQKKLEAYDADTFYGVERDSRDRDSDNALRIGGIDTPELKDRYGKPQYGAEEALQTARGYETGTTEFSGDRGYFGRRLGERINPAGQALSHELLFRGQAVAGSGSTAQQRAIERKLELDVQGLGLNPATNQQRRDYQVRRDNQQKYMDDLSKQDFGITTRDRQGFHSKALDRGTDQVQQMGYGALKWLGEVVGSDGLSEIAKAGISKNDLTMMLNPRETESWAESEGFADSVASVYETLIEQVPNIAVTFGTAIATGGVGAGITRMAAGRMAAKKIAAGEAASSAATQQFFKQAVAKGYGSGATTGAGVASVGMNLGETKITFDREGIDNNFKVFFTGLVKGAADMVGLAAIPGLKRLVGMGARASKVSPKKLWRDVPFKVMKAAAAEGTTEAFQAVADSVAVNTSLDREWSQQDTDAMIEAFVVGAAAGGVMGGVGASAQVAFQAPDPKIPAKPEDVPQTDPEPKVDIDAQMQALDAGQKNAVFVADDAIVLPEGKKAVFSGSREDGRFVVSIDSTQKGRTYFKSRKLAKEYADKVNGSTVEEANEVVLPKGAKPKVQVIKESQEAGTEPVVVQAANVLDEGDVHSVVQEVLVTEADTPAMMEQLQKEFPEQTIIRLSAEASLDRRAKILDQERVARAEAEKTGRPPTEEEIAETADVDNPVLTEEHAAEINTVAEGQAMEEQLTIQDDFAPDTGVEEQIAQQEAQDKAPDEVVLNDQEAIEVADLEKQHDAAKTPKEKEALRLAIKAAKTRHKLKMQANELLRKVEGTKSKKIVRKKPEKKSAAARKLSRETYEAKKVAEEQQHATAVATQKAKDIAEQEAEPKAEQEAEQEAEPKAEKKAEPKAEKKAEPKPVELNKSTTPRQRIPLNKITKAFREIFTKNSAIKKKELFLDIVTPFRGSLARLRRVSVALGSLYKKYMDKFHADESQFKAIVNNIYRNYTPQELEQGFAELIAGEAKTTAAKELQSFFDTFLKNMQDSSVERFKHMMLSDNGVPYFPQIHSQTIIRENRDGFISFLQTGNNGKPFTYRGYNGKTHVMDAKAAEAIADSLLSQSQGESFGPEAASSKRRILTDPAYQAAAFNAGWLNKDPRAIIEVYVSSMMKTKNYEEAFGGFESRGLEDLQRTLVSLGYHVGKGNVKALEDARKDAVKRGVLRASAEKGLFEVWVAGLEKKKMVEGIRERKGEGAAQEATKTMNGMDGLLGRDLNPKIRKTMQWAVVVQAYTILAFSTLSSIPELGVMMAGLAGKDPQLAWEGLKQFVVDTGDYTKQIKQGVGKGLSAKEAVAQARNNSMELARLMGVIPDALTATGFIDSSDFEVEGNKPRAAMEKLFTYNLNILFNNSLRSIASNVGGEYFIKQASIALNAKQSSEKAAAAKELARFGIDAEQVMAWDKDGRRNFAPNSEVRLSPMASALLEFADHHVARPTSSIKPVAGNDPHFMLITQLKSFFYAYGGTIIPEIGKTMANRYAGARRADKAYVLAGLNASLPLVIIATMAVPLAALSQEIKASIRSLADDDYEKRRKIYLDQMGEGERLADLVRASGALGPVDLMLSFYDAEQYGQSGVIRALGPTMGHLETLVKYGPLSPQFVQRGTPILGITSPGLWRDWKFQAAKEARADKREKRYNR